MKKIAGFLAGLFFLAFTGFASAEYIDNGDGTITDTSTNLMWQRSFASNLNWSDSDDFCTQLSLGGNTDWELPTISQLQSIVVPGIHPTIDPVFACPYNPNLYDNIYFWSDSTGSSVHDIWVLNFQDGGVLLESIESTQYLYSRCVRGTASDKCIFVGSDLTINIPCIQHNGVQYRVTLEYYTDPSLPPGMYFRLTNAEVQ